MKSLQLTLVFVFTLFALTTVLNAQTETGQITGTVLDPSGAAVPNAAITVKSVTTGSVRETTTSMSGGYTVTNLLPGVYSVTVNASGFAEVQQRATVSVGSKVGVDLHVQVGKASTVVEVAAAAVEVNTESQSLTTTVSGAQLNDLPTLNRNPYALVALSGNVSDAGAGNRGVGYSINGLRESGTNILLDGAANNDEFTASVGQRVPQESIAEFSVVTSDYTAEYGRASAGIVNVATKNGTNELHGSVYELNRVSALSSNSFNDNALGNPKGVFTRNQFGYSVGAPIKKNKLFFFSSTEWTRVASNANNQAMLPDPALIAASSPNTQAFFAAYGKLAPGSRVVQTYSLNQLTAAGTNLCPTKTAACGTLNPDAPAYDLVNFTAPTDAGGGSPEQEYQTVNRIDYNMSDKTQLYGRYALQSVNLTKGYASLSPYAGYNTGETDFNNNMLVSIIHTFSPRLVSQSKVVFNRLNENQPFGTYPAVPTLYTTSTGAGNLLGQSILYPGYVPQFPGNGIPFGGPQNFVQLYEDLSYNFGNHSLRFGGSFEYLRDNRTFGAYQTAGEYLGTSASSALSNFVLGQMRQFQVAVFPQNKFPGDTVNLPLTAPNFSRSNRYKEYATYVQDSWKVRPRLTLNLGLRWEYFGVPHNQDPSLDSNWYYPAGEINTPQGYRDGKLQSVPNSPIGSLWKKDFNNFAPRVGVAYDVFGDGKTSFRGGYGIGYERNFGNVTFNAIQNPPNYETISCTAASCGIALPISVSNYGPFSGSSGTITLPKATLRTPVENMKTAYAHTWSASLEHQVTNNFLIAADYSGSKGVGLYDVSVYNRPGYGNVFLGIPCSYAAGDCSAYLNNQYGGINTRGNNGFSNYHALNLRTSLKNVGNSGLTLTANYTWSHATDNLSTSFSDSDNFANNWGTQETGMLDPFNPQVNKGNADFDIRQRIVVGAVWELPVFKNGSGLTHKVLGGWVVAPILTIRTGSPYTLFDCYNAQYFCTMAALTGPLSTAANKNPTASAGGTPNQFDFLTIPGNIVDHFTNPTYFYSDLPPFPIDMTTRNEFRAPGNWNMDLAISKTFLFTERFKLKFSGEFFNAMNHANMYVEAASNDLSGTGAGQPPAIIQSCKGCTGLAADRRNVQLSAKFIF